MKKRIMAILIVSAIIMGSVMPVMASGDLQEATEAVMNTPIWAIFGEDVNVKFSPGDLKSPKYYFDLTSRQEINFNIKSDFRHQFLFIQDLNNGKAKQFQAHTENNMCLIDETLVLEPGTYFFFVSRLSEDSKKKGEVTYKVTQLTQSSVKKKSIKSVKAEDLVWTGKKLAPKITVKASNGTELKKGTDYTVTCKPTIVKEVGTYTATVKGKGNYTGSKTVTFKVNPKPTTISKLTPASKAITVKFNAQTKEMDGYYIQYSTNSGFKKVSETKKISVKKNVTSKKLTGLEGNKQYFVRIATYKKVNGRTYISKWSGTHAATTK